MNIWIIVTGDLNHLRWLLPTTIILTNIFYHSPEAEDFLTSHSINYMVVRGTMGAVENHTAEVVSTHNF